MSGNTPSIGTSITRVGGGNFRPGPYAGPHTTKTHGGFSPIKARIEDSANPITGGVGSQSRPPRGVQGGGFGGVADLPPGGFGSSGALQNGGGEVAKSDQNTPQKTSGTTANPYGKTTPPGQSPKDAFTNALLQKVLEDRKKGEEAVKRNKETGKVESIDTDKLNEKAKQEIDKLSETFKQSAKELDKSIEEFRTKFAEQLKGDGKLDGILDKVVNEAKADSMDPKSKKFNPQKFMDAAAELDKWIKDNPDAATKYGEDLTKINEKVQAMSRNAKEQIALAENNPATVLRAAELSAKNSSEEAGRLNEALTKKFESLPKADQDAVQGKDTDFKTQLKQTMETLNPAAGKVFDPEASSKSLDELKQAFNTIPGALINDPKITDSFKEVYDLGKRSVEGQKLARTEEPDPAKYRQKAEEYIKGANGLDATWAEHRTKPERESDIRAAVKDDALIDKSIADYKNENGPLKEKDAAAIDEITRPSPEKQRNDLETISFEDDDDSVDETIKDKVDETIKESVSKTTDDNIDEAIEDNLEDLDLDIE